MSTITHLDVFRVGLPDGSRIIDGNSFETNRTGLEDMGQEISIKLAGSCPDGDPGVILRVACRYFGCTRADLLTKGRTRAESERRFHVYRILYNWPLSYHEVGRYMPVNGKPRDHGTIMSGIRQHIALLKQSAGFKLDYQSLLDNVGQLLKREVQK